MSGIDRFTDPRSLANIKRILAKLADGKATTAELMESLFMSKANMARYIRHLRQEPRRIRIAAWLHTGGSKAPIYAIGQKDAPRPGIASGKVKYQRAVAAVKADPDRYDRYMASRRTADYMRRARKTPSTWLSALGVQ